MRVLICCWRLVTRLCYAAVTVYRLLWEFVTLLQQSFVLRSGPGVGCDAIHCRSRAVEWSVNCAAHAQQRCDLADDMRLP